MRGQLDRFGVAAARAVHGVHVTLADVGEQLAHHGLCRRQGNVDLCAVHQVGVAAPVHQREHARGAQLLGQQAAHDVVLVVVGGGDEEIHFVDVLVAEQVLVGAVAVQDQHRFIQLCGQILAAGAVAVDQLQVHMLLQRARQMQAHIAGTGNHHAAHRRAGAVHGRQHRADIVARHEEEHLVTRQDHAVRPAGHETVGLVGKAAVDRHHVHAGIGQQLGKPADRLPHHGGTGRGTHRHHECHAMGKLAHLQCLGKLHQLLDVARDRSLGADHVAHGKAVLAQQFHVLGPLGRAQARDAVRGMKAHEGGLAHRQVDGVIGRAGQQQVGIVGAGIGQHRRLRAVSQDAAQVEALLQLGQQFRIVVDHGDVVALGYQMLGDAFADAAGTEDDDFHGNKSGCEWEPFTGGSAGGCWSSAAGGSGLAGCRGSSPAVSSVVRKGASAPVSASAGSLS